MSAFLSRRSWSLPSWGASAIADADVDVDLVVVEREGLSQAFEHTPAQEMSIVRLLDADLNDAEFVAAQARHGVGRPHAGLQPLGGLLQQEIARAVAEGVVDLLEVIEVEAKDRGPEAAPAGVRQGKVQALAQQHAVRQAGQRVMQRQVLGLRLGLDLGSDVGGRAAIAEKVAAGVEDRAAGQAADAGLPISVAIAAAKIAERLMRLNVAPEAGPAVGGRIAREELVDRAAQEIRRGDPGHLAETIREIGQAQLGIGLPDPVRGGFGDVAETRLARLERARVGLDGLRGTPRSPRPTAGRDRAPAR